MNAGDEQLREIIAGQAGEWLVAHRAGPVSPAEQRAFYAWLTTSPLHIEEYLGVAALARHLPVAADDPQMPLESILERARAEGAGGVPLTTQPPPPSASRWVDLRRRGLWAAVPAALAAIGFAWFSFKVDHVTTQNYATRHGELRSLRLSDQSTLHLNTDTSITVRYSRSERHVEVDRGEVLFEVAHEPQRPFRVLAGFANMRAVGTVFNVFRQPDSTIVTVVEGQVAVGLSSAQGAAAPAGGRTVLVHAGEKLQVSQGSLPGTAVPADPERSTAWLRRQIVFEQEPLGKVAEEFNRYSATPIEIETPELKSMKVSGALSADDAETLVDFLKSLDGVKVEVTGTKIRVSRK